MTTKKTTKTHRGGERAYLKWRLNQLLQGKNPGAPDYVAVRRNRKWEVPA